MEDYRCAFRRKKGAAQCTLTMTFNILVPCITMRIDLWNADLAACVRKDRFD